MTTTTVEAPPSIPNKEIKKPTRIPQKGCSFLIQDSNPDHIFISEEWNEEQRMIYDMVKDFCVKEVFNEMKNRGREFEADKDRDEIIQILEKSAELGLCGVSIGEQYGGIDLDFNTSCLFAEAVAYGFSFATTIGAQTSIGSLPIVYYGTEEQKQKYLPGIASAELKAAYCLTEPRAGSDANSGKTSAVLNEAGTHYILNGQKMWITNGGFADIFIVFARIDDDKNLSAFIIEKDFGGITIGAEERKLGIKGSSTVQVFFEDCPVPKENLLGERNGGFKIALNILNTGRIKLAAGATGGCKIAIDQAVNYAQQREQFGQAIASFGAIKHKIGQMTVLAFAGDAATYRTGQNISDKTKQFLAEDKSENEAKLNGIREYAVECSILKVKCSENVDYCIDECLQIFGGMGYSAEAGIEMGYRDARITRIYEGTNEINRMLSLAELTKRAIKTKEVDLVSAGKKIPAYIIRQMLPFKSNTGWKQEERIVKNIKTLFMMLSGKAGQKLKEKLVDEQEIVINFADILAEAYIAESVLLKVQKLEKNKLYQGEDFAVRKKILQVYLYESINICRKAAQDAIHAFATGREKNMLRRFTKTLLPMYDVNVKALRRDIAEYVYSKGGYTL